VPADDMLAGARCLAHSPGVVLARCRDRPMVARATAPRTE